MIGGVIERPKIATAGLARWGGGAALASLAALMAIAWFIHGRSFALLGTTGDDLYNLDWADRSPAAAILRGETAYYPEWRPLASLAVWLQYQWAGLDHVGAYYAVNLLIWVVCAWLVCRLVVMMTGSTLAGLLGGWVVLADPRPIYVVIWIIERQTSLACLFGLLAFLVFLRVVRRKQGAMSWVEWTALVLLLLASALSKEFGLAFAAALVVYAWRAPHQRAASAAVVSVLAYVALRVWFTGGAVSRVCEEMGYFSSTRVVCFVPVDRTSVVQAVYNVAAAGIDSVLPGLFSGDGRIALATSHLPASVLWLVLAAVGVWKGPRILRAAVLMLAVNAVLNFMIYRDRNHAIGLCAMAVAAGVGWVMADGILATRPRPQPARMALLGIVVALLLVQSVQTRRVVGSIVDTALQQDPCTAITDVPGLDPKFVSRVKTRYGMPDPECIAGR